MLDIFIWISTGMLIIPIGGMIIDHFKEVVPEDLNWLKKEVAKALNNAENAKKATNRTPGQQKRKVA